MKFTAPALLILLIPNVAQCKRARPSLLDETKTARKAEDRLSSTPNLLPEEATRLREEKYEASATQGATRGPGVAMTNAGSLDAQKQIALGWSRIKLDPAAALKNFEAAITADPKSAAVRVQRSRARREAGDAAGALGDANDAIRMQPDLGEAYAARAEADRSLGRAEADLLADYEAAAKLDGRFTDAYKTALIRSGAGDDAVAISKEKSTGKGGLAEASTPAGPLGLLERAPRYWGLFAFMFAMLAAAGGIIVPLMLKKKRSGEDGSLPR